MPGVPTGRGCDACRRQKKKCDQSKPTCGRCVRLRIPCVGSGQRRFKFVEGNPVKTEAFQASRPAVVSAPRGLPPPLPSNKLSKAASAFVYRLEVHDPRYNLRVYGPFLDSLPQRLGRNAALDAAIHAMAISLPVVYTHKPSPESYGSYIHALKALRLSLENPATLHSVDTLCAMYLIMILQGWLGKEGDNLNFHGQALTHLLQVAVLQSWQGRFEAELLLTLCATAMMESLMNPKLELDSWYTRLLAHFPEGDPSFPTKELRGLRKIPIYVRYPEVNIKAIRGLYTSLQFTGAQCRQELEGLQNGAPTPPLTMAYSSLQANYASMLMLLIVTNAILSIFYPSEVQLRSDWLDMYEDVIVVAKNALAFRPLGASYAPLCLLCAWATTEDATKKAETEALIKDYQYFPSLRWLTYRSWLVARLDTFRERLVVRQAETEGALDAARDAIDAGDGVFVEKGEPCCIL